jgi:hypothetical protein
MQLCQMLLARYVLAVYVRKLLEIDYLKPNEGKNQRSRKILENSTIEKYRVTCAILKVSFSQSFQLEKFKTKVPKY